MEGVTLMLTVRGEVFAAESVDARDLLFQVIFVIDQNRRKTPVRIVGNAIWRLNQS